MSKKPTESSLSPTNVEEVIMDVANLNAPEESVNRVVRHVLEGTTQVPVSRPANRSSRPYVAMGTAVLALVAVFLFLVNLSPGNIAFAQVQEQLESTQSLQYVEYLTEAGAKAKLKRAQRMLEMMLIEIESVKENGRSFDAEKVNKRIARLKSDIQDLEDKIETGAPVVSRRVWIQGRYLHRSEQSSMGSHVISISNAKTGESVTLDVELKSCTLLKTQTVLNMQTGEKTVTDLGPNPAANFYAAMTQIPPGEVTKLGEKPMNDKQAVGFQQTEDLHDCVITRTYWIDKLTRLPIRMEAVVKRDGVTIRGTTIRDMVFNQELDEMLFSTTPPEGFSIREGGIMGLDPGTAD